MSDYIIYQKIREEVSKKNKNLVSREKAAKVLGISPMSLNNYEMGVTVPPAKIITKMAEIYGTPELRYHYCRNICEMDSPHIPDVDINLTSLDVERLTLRLLKSLKAVPGMKERLIDIAEDGVINEEEIASFNKILDELSDIVKHALELQIWAKKRIRS